MGKSGNGEEGRNFKAESGNPPLMGGFRRRPNGLWRAGWRDESAAELAKRRKGDPEKAALARRLRAETTMTLKRIAGEMHMGSWTHVSNLPGQPA